MKFESYINENSENLISILEKNVNKSFIRDLKKTQEFIYRGTSKYIDPFAIIRSIKNRRPKDMPLKIHKMLDDKFYEKFGWGVRSEGIFATSDIYLTELWDDIKDASYNPYLFFPLKNYYFVWSKSVGDLYNTLQLRAQEKVKYHDYRKKYLDEIDEENIEEIIDEVIKTYETGNLVAAIKSESEISFKCDSYILINIKNRDMIKDWLKI